VAAVTRPIAVVGPTATGKSALALQLAQALDGEVINADAMQLYRGMDIGTAKTPVPQRGGMPHHQLDVLDVTETASVAHYQRAARHDVEAVLARGHTPIIVGGSGLYVQALLDELSFPATDAAVRARSARPPRRWDSRGGTPSSLDWIGTPLSSTRGSRPDRLPCSQADSPQKCRHWSSSASVAG